MTRRPSILKQGADIGTLYFVALLRKELGQRIQDARRQAGLTQRELADLIGLKNATDISRYERGLVEVRDFRIDRIAEATGKPRSYFLRDPDEPEPAPSPAPADDRLAQVTAELAEVRALLAGLLERLDDPGGSVRHRSLSIVRRRQSSTP